MATWPTLEGLEPKVKRREIRPDIDIFTSDAGTELRRGTWTGPRYEYDLSYACLRTDVTVSAPGQAYNGMSELGALMYLFSIALGTFGEHAFTEPAALGGATRAVRFKDGSLEVSQEDSDTVWSCSLTLISVL